MVFSWVHNAHLKSTGDTFRFRPFKSGRASHAFTNHRTVNDTTCNRGQVRCSTRTQLFLMHVQFVIVIDLFNETVLFNHRGGRSPPRLLNRQSS